MATVASVTLNKDGTATTGEGDTLIGTAEEHIESIKNRLIAFGHDVEDAFERAREIVESHTLKTADEAAADASVVAEDAAKDASVVAKDAPEAAAVVDKVAQVA